MPFDFTLIYVLAIVFFLEGILSIDNAAVLGAMVSALPPDEKVPWPKALRFLTTPIHRLLGGQRPAALKVGLLGAYIGRGAMLVLASWVIQNPWLKLVGALYLIKLAFENLAQAEPGEEQQVEVDRVARRGFWGVVLAVELADLACSLDNVVAVVAVSDQLWIVMFGVFMGILTMRFAAGIFTLLIMKEPILKTAAYIVVFNIGAELLLDEFYGIEVHSAIKFLISAGTLIFAVLYAHSRQLQLLRPVFVWVGEGMGNFNELLDWALKPPVALIKIVFQLVYGLGASLLAPYRASAQRNASNQR